MTGGLSTELTPTWASDQGDPVGLSCSPPEGRVRLWSWWVGMAGGRAEVHRAASQGACASLSGGGGCSEGV